MGRPIRMKKCRDSIVGGECEALALALALAQPVIISQTLAMCGGFVCLRVEGGVLMIECWDEYF